MPAWNVCHGPNGIALAPQMPKLPIYVQSNSIDYKWENIQIYIDYNGNSDT